MYLSIVEEIQLNQLKTQDYLYYMYYISQKGSK